MIIWFTTHYSIFIFRLFLDVIGQIVEYSHVEIVSVNGKDTEKITVELRNEK